MRKSVSLKLLIFTLFIIVLNVLLVSKDDLQKQKSYEFRSLSIENGLSQNTVISICQDKYGYIWFGTQYGLNKYNGKEFKVFRHSNKYSSSLISSNVRRIIETSDGELWIGTNNGGLSRFIREDESFENFTYDKDNESSLSGIDVFALIEDRKKNIWVGTLGSGLNKFNRKTGKFKRYKYNPEDSDSLSSNFVRDIFEDSEGIIWVGNNLGGLNRYNPKTDSFDRFCYSESGNFNDDSIMVIYEITPQLLIIGTDGDGIKIFDKSKGGYKKISDEMLPEYLKNGRIRDFYMDERGFLWIATFGNGLVTLNPGKHKNRNIINYKSDGLNSRSLNNDKVLDIYMIKEGLLLFGTSGGGVNILDFEMSFFKNYRSYFLDNNIISLKNARCISEDKKGRVYIGSDGNGLNIISEKGKNKLLKFGENRVYSLCIDSFENLWVGTYGNGLFSLSKDFKNKVSYYNVNKNGFMNGKFVRVIFEDRDKTLWFGTRDQGVYRFNRNLKNFKRYVHKKGEKYGINHNFVTSIIDGEKNQIFIGTWSGVNRFDKIEEKFYKYRIKLKGIRGKVINVLTLLYDKDGILWIGTWGNGLIKYDPDKKTSKLFNEDEGFQNNVIYGILEENTDNESSILWISTNKGIVRFDTKNESSKVFDISTGIQSNEFNSGAYFKNKNGDMYFGGIDGVTKFNPVNIKNNAYSPKILITDIAVFNKRKKFSVPVEDINEVSFNYDENYFMIKFIQTSYRSSNRNSYMYKLEGFDKDWVKSGKRNNASYTNLEAGEYTFMVKGFNNDGVQSNEITKLKIIIIPAFWQTLWFKLLIVILFVILLILLFFFKTKKFYHEKKMLREVNDKLNKEIEERRKLEEERAILHKRLIQSEKMEVLGTLAGGVAHDLNNILGAIVSYPDLLLMKLPKDSPLRKPVLAIQQSGKKAAAVVNDLLTLARSGVQTKKVLNLNDIIVALINSPELESIKKNNPLVDISLNLDENLNNIMGSDIHILKSLLNLMLNSFEAIKNEGKILISTLNIKINKSCKLSGSLLKAGDYAVFRILDNGEGIEEEDINRIFEPFYTKKKMGRSGTGLGMAIVLNMVSNHKGELDIWSEKGVGTSIDIYLPATKKKIELVKNTKHISELYGNKEEILVVDDVKLQREIATTLLEKLNYKVYSVSSGEEGLEFLKENTVDLVLLDMIMDPGIDGLTTYKKIRKMKKQKVIVVSGFSKPEKVEEIMRLGIDSYISKPYTIETLGKAVKKVLGK